MATIAVAGATGFVGTALIDKLKANHSVIALTRGIARGSEKGGVEWRRCDLFSLLQAEKALQGADYAVYLVHSMLPSAELSQGSFQDWDLLAADNFVRACQTAGVKHILYLGGIIPDLETLSPHLESRLEVERVLGSSSIPLTAFRTAIILGRGSSSLNMIVRLVRRLPLMVCPSWTGTLSRPIHIDDVVAVMSRCIGEEAHFSNVYDLGGPDALSYRDLMHAVAEQQGKKRLILQVPVVTPKLSRLWISLVTGAPRTLVAPLVESLRHEMLPAQQRKLDLPDQQLTSVRDALRKELSPGAESVVPRAFSLPPDEQQYHLVQSVQRLPLPSGMDAAGVADEDQRWLPKFLWPVLDVQVEGISCAFYARGVSKPLLVLERSVERSSSSRVLYYICGGVLVRDAAGRRGRLEFREVSDRRYILAAVHDFRPALPWYIYKYSQALAHLWVMGGFRAHLQSF